MASSIEVPIDSHTDEISSVTDLGLFISRMAGVALLIAGVAVFGYLVWGGISWLTAGSDTTKVEEARTRITNALIGLAIVAVAWAVYLIIDYFFGIGIANSSATIGN